MKPVTKFLILSGAILGAWYIPTLFAALKMKFAITGFAVDAIKSNYINATVRLKAINMAYININVTDVKGYIILQGVKIGAFSHSTKITIPARGEYDLNISFTIDYKITGKMLWHTLINSNLQNAKFTLTGEVTANHKQLPFTSSWTVNDITN